MNLIILLVGKTNNVVIWLIMFNAFCRCLHYFVCEYALNIYFNDNTMNLIILLVGKTNNVVIWLIMFNAFCRCLHYFVCEYYDHICVIYLLTVHYILIGKVITASDNITNITIIITFLCRRKT